MSFEFEYPVLNDDEIKKEREEFLATLKPLAPGAYDFQVMSAAHKVNEASGNHMIELKLKVWGHDGKEYVIFDWLVSAKNSAYKIKSFWECVGHPENYNGKANAEDFLNQMGKVEIINAKDKKDVLRAKVKNYVKPEKKDDPFHDDDIAF